jgi:hypothetical protein
MSNDPNGPSPDLRTTSLSRRLPWVPWVVILAAIILAALAWNFWPRTSPTDATAPAGQTTTTQPPATTTPPATAPAQQ